ncbi:MAG: transketolase [Oceanicoccus sp.]|jgi:transketolase
MNLPQLGQPLNEEHIAFLNVFAKSCRRSIIQMVTNAQSGHPGGSLSSLDFLSLIYAMRVCETNEPVVVSIGHISPAVYSVLAELGVIPKERVIKTFRTPDDIYEGHVNRKIRGVHYGTGPLGAGGSVGAAFALGNHLNKNDELSFLVMGDGEQQEGQVWEMMNFANKFELGNLVLFIDHNKVQLTDSLEEIMPINLPEAYKAAGWNVIEVDGHDFSAMWDAIGNAEKSDKPTVLIGDTVMGQGVEFMAETGRNIKADWHGKAPKPEQVEPALKEIELTEDELAILKAGLAMLPDNIQTPGEPEFEVKGDLNVGEPTLYSVDTFTDCRSAYGDALLDLAKLNENVLAMTADVAGSVKTTGVKKNFPDRHIECGIAEQHMVSVAGGLSIRGFVPFCSTFGAFMSSRAKDQARVNDINECNAKMVATHCGLSVGEDGPTHQAIDDISSFLGFMHTNIYEPADPNHCDRIIRYVANHYGNVYVRMGRAKLPIITKEDGTPFYDENYEVKPGKADLIRTGSKATIIAAGPMVERALKAAERMGGDIEVIAVGCLQPFDHGTVMDSLRKTGRVVTVHDHHVRTGLAIQVQKTIVDSGLSVKMEALGVDHYQLSGKADELYELAGLAVHHIVEAVNSLD